MRLDIGKCYVGETGALFEGTIFKVIEADDRGWVRAKVWSAFFAFHTAQIHFEGEKWLNTNQFREIKEWRQVPIES